MKKLYKIMFITELGVCYRETTNVVTALKFQKILTKLGYTSTIAEINA